MRAFVALVILLCGGWSQVAALDCPMLGVGFEVAVHGPDSGGAGSAHALHEGPNEPAGGHAGHDDSSSHPPASECGVMMTCAPAAPGLPPTMTHLQVTTAITSPVPPMATGDSIRAFEPPPPRFVGPVPQEL